MLRFLGVPILAAPVLTFPATEARKSGWLPPSLNIDSRAGVDLAIPYYWNIAPHLDATLTPGFMTRRGLSMQGEFRYLLPQDEGAVEAHLLPDDSSADRSRRRRMLSPRTMAAANMMGVDTSACQGAEPVTTPAITNGSR